MEGVSLQLIGLPSPYWGQDQVVTGLLTGQDLLDGLLGKDLGDELLLPSVMLRQGQPVFLDDMTLETVQAQIPVPIRVVHGAADIVASVLSSRRKKLLKLNKRFVRAVHRFPASLLLIAGVLATGASPVLGQSSSSEDSASALVDQSALPTAPAAQRCERPRIKNGAVAPAATELPPPLLPLTAPPSLAHCLIKISK